jgi:hypothetical protein
VSEQKNEFRPIESQEEFDARLGKRLAAERDKWERESGIEEARTKVQAEIDKLSAAVEDKDKELAGVHKEHRLGELQRTTRELLAERGVEDEARQQRVMRLLDFDGALASEAEEPVSLVEWQLKQLANDVPELLSTREFPMGAGSGGSSKPVLSREKPLTEEELAKMSPDEMSRPGVMERVDKFMKGER